MPTPKNYAIMILVMKDPTIIKLLEEIHQAPKIRQDLIKRIERSKEFGGFQILLFFTSFRHPVSIEDGDANIIEGILQTMGKKKSLLLVLNSPGGSALAAERIINVCRSYSESGYSVLIPKMAKSAATIIAFGAKKLYMSPTSELGPVDPQIKVGNELISAYSIIESYKELLRNAAKEKGRIEPYLQQLGNYDPKKIKELELIQGLSDDIAVKYLQSGMLKGKSNGEIRKAIRPYITPEKTKVHGRPIYPNDISKQGLNVEVIDPISKIWELCWELFIRAEYVVNNTGVVKLVETGEHNFSVGLRN